MTHKVCNNKEVTWKSHLCHDIEFILQTCAIFLSCLIAHLLKKTAHRFFTEPRIFRLPFWNTKCWKQVLILTKCHIATLCNQQGVIAGFWNIFKELTHLRWGFQIELIIIKFKSLGICQGGARLHAEQSRMGCSIFVTCVVKIVGSKQRKLELFS